MNITVPIQLMEGAQLPAYQTSGAAGMDLHSIHDVVIPPNRRVLVKTGLKVAIPVGYEGQIRPRSGLALKHGISVVNSPGTIDSDYRGEIGVILINHGTDTVTLAAGERVAQIVFAPVAWAFFAQVDDIANLPTERGEGGFGSTGLHLIEMSIMPNLKTETVLSDGRVIEGTIIATTPAERAAIGA